MPDSIGTGTFTSGEPIYMCGVTEQVRPGGSKWGIKQISWCINNHILSSASGKVLQETATELAFKAWSSVCGLTFKKVKTPQTANIIISVGRGRRANFDGRNGTLAYAYLPPNNNFSGQLGLYFDLDEQWSFAPPPFSANTNGIYYVNVCAHEIGHNLGLDHSSPNDQDQDLMDPFYKWNIWGPKRGDVRRAISLYGLPTDIPETPINPDDPSTPTPPSSISDEEFDRLARRWVNTLLNR